MDICDPFDELSADRSHMTRVYRISGIVARYSRFFHLPEAWAIRYAQELSST
jgi:hypothetical protein